MTSIFNWDVVKYFVTSTWKIFYEFPNLFLHYFNEKGHAQMTGMYNKRLLLCILEVRYIFVEFKIKQNTENNRIKESR